jgi:hypothetical protein
MTQLSSATGKRDCRTKTERAIRNGIINRKRICEDCKKDKPRIEAHHPDYERPLLVEWLCQSCHAKHEKHSRKTYPEWFDLSTTHISIRVTEEEKEQYRQLAEKDGRTLTEIIKSYLCRLLRSQK